MLERLDQRQNLVVVWPWHFLWRHQARAELADHILRELGVPIGMVDIERLQAHTSGKRVVVVARDAVFLNHGHRQRRLLGNRQACGKNERAQNRRSASSHCCLHRPRKFRMRGMIHFVWNGAKAPK